MGETAISEYLLSRSEHNVFCEKLSFKNYPFNSLYSLDDSKYTVPNQYISIWKYLIYSSVCKSMSRNNNIDSALSTILTTIYNNDPVKTLRRTIEKWTAEGFGAELMGFGGSVVGSKKKDDSLTWIEKTDLLEDIITGNIDNSYYYIIFDELDEDYRDFKTDEEKEFYINLLTSLFKAVQDVKACFKGNEINILPIVFLRIDIYDLLNDSDKNKWSDFKLDLSWNSAELKAMISHRISKTFNASDEKPNSWDSIFSDAQVKMGHQGRQSMDVFSYITRSTHMRPRDYIHYVRECAKLSLQKMKVLYLRKL